MKAILLVYGHALAHVNWGEREFPQLPSSGDLVHLKSEDGIAVVRHVEYLVDDLPIVVTDWRDLDSFL